MHIADTNLVCPLNTRLQRPVSRSHCQQQRSECKSRWQVEHLASSIVARTRKQSRCGVVSVSASACVEVTHPCSLFQPRALCSRNSCALQRFAHTRLSSHKRSIASRIPGILMITSSYSSFYNRATCSGGGKYNPPLARSQGRSTLGVSLLSNFQGAPTKTSGLPCAD